MNADAPLPTLIAIFTFFAAMTHSIDSTVGGNFEIIDKGFLAKRSTKFARLSCVSSS